MGVCVGGTTTTTPTTSTTTTTIPVTTTTVPVITTTLPVGDNTTEVGFMKDLSYGTLSFIGFTLPAFVILVFALSFATFIVAIGKKMKDW